MAYDEVKARTNEIIVNEYSSFWGEVGTIAIFMCKEEDKSLRIRF